MKVLKVLNVVWLILSLVLFALCLYDAIHAKGEFEFVLGIVFGYANMAIVVARTAWLYQDITE